jgi:hypothetical protein
MTIERFPNETDYEYVKRLEAEVEQLRAVNTDLLAALETLVPFAMGKIRELSGLPFYGLTETGTADPPEVAAILNASNFEIARTAIAKGRRNDP